MTSKKSRLVNLLIYYKFINTNLAIEYDDKEDASSIPMTIIPDPEEKSAIEEAVKTLRSDPESQAVQNELSVAKENKVDSSIATTVIADQEEKSAIEEAVKTLRTDQEEGTSKVGEKTEEKLPEEAELAKEAISSAVSAINKELVIEPVEIEPKNEESKVEESYQGSDPKEVEGSIIKVRQSFLIVVVNFSIRKASKKE